jgi:hypothetical protein
MLSALFCCLFYTTAIWAYHAPPPDYDPSTTEQIHEGVSSTVADLANDIDAFFGERRAFDRNNRSTLQIAQTQEVPEGRIPPTRTSVALNLRLINFEQLGQKVGEAFLGVEDEETYQKDPRNYPDFVRPPRDQKKPLRAKKGNKYPWRLAMDQQVIGNIPPGYIARLRATKDFEAFNVLHHFQHEFGYDTDNIWTTRIAFTTDKQVHSKWLVRWSNDLGWLIDRFVAYSSHGPTFVHTITPRTFAAYNFRMNNTLFDRVYFTSNYFAGITFRQDIYSGWIFFNIEPSLTWPRDQDFKRVWNLILRLEAIFG